jgi:hypothetical protein
LPPRITKQQSAPPMKNSPFIIASLLVGSVAVSSCSSNKIASSGVDDNLYFMASDVKMATEFAVANNTPQSFRNITQEPALAEENFSSRNVNPEYISRYQATENATTSDDGVVYFDELATDQNTTGNIHAYDNYSTAGNGNGNGYNGFSNVNFNFGLGYGFSPFGWGMSPYMGLNYGLGFMPGFSFGLGFGMGYPMFPGYGFGYPMYGYPMYGYGYPMHRFGYPMYSGFGYPVYSGYPGYVLPGGEYGDRRVVSGARPTRGSSIANTGVRRTDAGVMPGTARSQARNNANAVNPSARRVVASESGRASRDFSNSQNDYYNSRGRVATTRNNNSPAADRAVSTRSRTSVPSARPATTNAAGSNVRNYASPSRGNSDYNTRTSSPSYNRGTVPTYNRNASPSYNNRSTSPSYDRGSSPSYNRSTTPSRTNNTPSYSAPSRTNSGGSFSAPSRSSGGSSGGSTGGSRGGRGN